MAYKSKFMQEMEQQGKLSAASGTSKYKSKFFQEGGHLEKEVAPAPMRTPTDRTFAGVKTTPAELKPVAERPTEQQNQISSEIAARTAGAGSRDHIGTSAHMTKISGLQVQEAELKLNQSKAKLDAARQKEMALTEQSKKLASAQQGLQQLMAQYEMSGDDVTGQAYLLAAEEYNKLLEQYQKDYAAYEKDASVYDEYNSNLLKYQKAYAGYEKNMQNYNTERADYLQEHPEIVLQDASDREIQRTLDRLESEKSGLILTGKAVDWEAVEDVNRKIDAVKQLQQQKRLSADNGAWNSGLTAFLDRAEAAIQAGQMEWFAGVAAVDQKLSNAFLKIAGSQIASMGMSMRNADMEAYGKTLMENSNRESKDAAEAMKASRDYMAEALTGAGKIDGWIVEKMQSVGSMMMDMMAAGSTYAMGIPAGADAGKIMAIRAGGSGMLQAQQEGKSETEQLLMGIATGALEYASERMFGGNPIYDAESGWVTDAVEKVIKNPKILKLMYSDGFGIFSEGLEETFVDFMEPVAEGIITLEKPELATAAELADAFAGGVFLSLMGQGSSVVVREVSGAGRAERQAGRVIQRSDAVQELVSEGLAAKPNTEAFKLATELQEKLRAGKKLSAAEIGRQLFANQDAIDAGLLVDDEMQPDSEAPEGALQDPENGYYAIQTAEADGKQTYQLVEVREDGGIRKIGKPADDLMAAKRAAQAQGLNVRHIGREDVLRDAAERIATDPAEPRNDGDNQNIVAVNAADNENTGLRWAGNEEGAYDYGTEQRNVGTGADQERIGGNADGRPAEGQNGGWAGDTVRRAEEARRIRAYAENAGLERRSLKELGFTQGSEGKNLRVLNRSAGQDVAEAFDMAQSAGLRLVPVSGNMYVQMGEDESRVNGIIENGVIYAQADSTAMSIKEVVNHEIFHDRVKKDPALVRQLVRYMFDNYSQQEISRQFQKYYDDYQAIYSGTASDADLNELIWEEFLADAYAEYSRYGDVALEGLSEEVQEQAWISEEGADKNNQKARFSFAGRSAETADRDQKRRAEEMEKQGVTAAEIYEETGWYRGKDGEWRFELDDSQMEYSRRGDLEFRKEHPSYGRYRDLLAKADDYMVGKSNDWLTMEEQAELTELQRVWTGTFKKDGQVGEDARPKTKLTDYIKHDALFEAYPELRNTSLIFEGMERGERGKYDRRSDTIYVNENLRHAPEDVLIHELQHAIQRIENFAGGSSVEYWDMRKREGLDIRENDRRIAEADREYQRLFRSAPEELQDKIRAINRAKLRDDWDTVLEIEDQIYGTEHEDLYVRLGDADFDRGMERGDEITSADLYWNTAGEIEARNAAERRKLTKDQRRDMFPELGDENTVFTNNRYAGWAYSKDYDGESASIKQQIENSLDLLNKMDVVASVTVPKNLQKKDAAVRWATEILKPTGYRVDRQGYGEIYFAKEDLDQGMRYADTPEEKAAVVLLPKVLKRGVEIGSHGNHKNREKQTFTIAAPVEMNGQRGNMAVVVNRHGSRYYAHRIVLPDGTEFRFADKNINAAQELSRGVTENGSLAKTTSAASETIIDRDGEGVNTRFSVSSEDRARQKAERDLARSIGEIMSLPRKAVQQLQTGLVRDIMEEYQLTGELNTEKLEEAAANAFAQGLIIDNEYYEQYKHIRDQLRTTAVTISQQDQADIADYNQFRKRAFGTLRIVKQGGIPVDSLYQELMETTPELFPRTITHPADQLVHMYEVAREIRRVETPLERAMGEQSDQFYEWAEGKIAQTVERILTRYAGSVTWKQQKAPTRKTAALADGTPDTYDRANERMYRSGQERMSGYDPEYEEAAPDTYDPKAQEGMYDYGQQSYREMPVPGSGRVQEDYIQPEEGGVVWAGQSRVGNWRQELPEYQPDTYDPRTQENMERFGQEIIDDYEPLPEEPEVLTEEERARRGTMREWIQYVLSDKLTPEQFAERMRSSAVGELKGGAAKLVGRMEETARQRQGDGVNLYRDPDMTDEQSEALNAAWKNRQERKTEKLETAEQIIIPKEAFRSTPAMDKLGIKIDGSVTRYRETAQLRAYDEAAEKAQKMLNRRIRKLKASAEEMDLAKMLVKGTITPAMLDREALNLNTITELADYLGAVESFNDDRINQRRAEINTNNLKVAKELLQDSEAYHPQLPGVLAGMTKLVMNERTPERVVKQIFGTEQGGKIYETYFRPVWVNGAEMHRFENRMLKRVAEFKDQDGRTRKLTEKEREFAQRLMEGEAVRLRMEELEQKDPDARERIADAAHNVNNGMEFLDAVRDQNIQDEEHQGLVQAYADYMDTVEAARDMDQTILWNAIRTYQQIYNEMYEAMNDFLVSHGYKPMGFIKGYAPHFQKREVQQGLFGALKALGVEKESATELPASIAGRTADFKPNMKWNPHMQSRQGTDTSYDIQMGFEQYLHYAAEMFYHTDDVMRIRQAVNWMRGQYSGEEISDAIKDAEVDQFKSVEWKRDFLLKKEFIKPQDDLDAKAIQQAYQEYVTGLFERVKPENLRKYSEFVTWLDNYANIVAGKQSLADRGLEYGGGRNALNMGSKLMRRFASANVAGNISSVLNQSAQLPLLQQQLGTYLERAVFDLARGGARKENFAERSDFLTDKRGVDKLTTDNMEKFISGLFKPAKMMDRLVSTLAVRGRYLQELDQGMTPDEALKAADDFGRRVMGSRMKGARPLGFESKTFVNQMLHIFQTEASNTFDYMLLSDIPQAVKEVRKTKGKAAAARYTAGAIVGYLLGAFLLNSLTDELYGGSPAPFDLMGWLLNFVAGGWGRDNEEFVKTVIDNAWERAYGERPFETEQLDREEGFQWAGAVDDLGYNVLGDVPYVRNALGVMGLGDQSMPTVGIKEVFGGAWGAGKTLWDQALKGSEETGLDWAEAIADAAESLGSAIVQIAPGGRQISKSYQGIKGVAMGGKVSGFGENARLQYPIEQNAWNAIRAGLFGLTALYETDAFYAGGQALTAGQTKKVRELEDKGIDQNITYELYQEFRQINKDLEGSEASEAKRNAINNLPMEDQQKLTVFDTFMLNKNSKNYEKTLSEYQAMLDAGLSWSEVTDAHNTYAMLDADEEMRGTEKATEFAKWVDMQGWNDEQRGAVEARFRFWNMMPAEATNYTKFEAAGLDPEQAAAATELLAALTPEEGKETVSVNQKVMELQKSKLPADEKMDAIAALVPDRQARFVEAGVPDETAKTLAAEIAIAEAENGDDEVTYLEKARIAVDRTPNDEDALAAMSVVLNDSTYAKVEVIREYGVRCENWVSFREEWLDRYGDDSMSQEKVKTVLDHMNLNNRQKAALWQISNKSWNPDNNPYDAYVAEMVWDALN